MDTIPGWAKRVWNALDIRVLVLLSLALQITLSILGNRRKYIPSQWIRVVVWSAYAAANWVATVAIGKLSDVLADPSNINSDNVSVNLQGLWSPLLLLHLGGPDTITAYSLEDNSLLKRDLLGLVVQVVVAIYAILLSWRASWVSYLSFPALVAGIVKYGERIWVLMHVDHKGIDHIVPFFGDKYHLARETVHRAAEVLVVECFPNIKAQIAKWDPPSTSVDLWSISEVEMGLWYDILYTKATITYTRVGLILRCVTMACTVFLLFGFVVTWVNVLKNDSNIVDVIVTAILVGGAMGLEIYGAVLSLCSDWAVIGLEKRWMKLQRKIPRLFEVVDKRRRWSNMMGQCNVLEFCATKRKPLISKWKSGMLDLHMTRAQVPHNLPKIVYEFIKVLDNRVQERSSNGPIERCLQQLPECQYGDRILVLHLLTEIFYHGNLKLCGCGSCPRFSSIPVVGGAFTNRSKIPSAAAKKIRGTCRMLSHYSMYLLLFHPSLLPSSGSKSYFLAKEHFVFIRDHLQMDSPTKILCEIFERLQGEKLAILKAFDEMVKLDSSSDAVDGLWFTLSLVWLGILWDAAQQCDKSEHFQQLRRGGELITLLWLLHEQKNSIAAIRRSDDLGDLTSLV